MKVQFTSLFLLCQFSNAALITIPPWKGTYGVGHTVMAMTDTSRMDGLAPKPEHRSILVTSYYPVGERSDCDWTPYKYMPDKTAAFWSKRLSQQLGFKIPVGSVRLQTCHLTNPSNYDSNVSNFGNTDFPLVLFSPGDSSSRLWHGAQAQAIASLGYVVVAIDHPYDALIVEYPDGKVVLSPTDDADDPLQEKRTITRVYDFGFVLDELSKPEVVTKLVPNRHPSIPLNTTYVPMYGHSSGGGSAGYAMQIGEKRIAGTLNMDGTAPAAQRPLNINIEQPYMFMQAERQPEWPKLWPLTNWGLWIKLARSHHGAFQDLPILAHLMGLEPVPHEVGHVIGYLPGDEVMNIIINYAHAFFQFLLNGKEPKLLQEVSKDFPDVSFVRSKKT